MNSRMNANCFTDLRLPDGFPIAMAYVKWQTLDEATMYSPDTALQKGTLFPDLDKPFCGMTVTGGNLR